MFEAPILLLALSLHWTSQPSNSSASLRGLSVVSGKVAWASGTEGTVLSSQDGGETWKRFTVPGAENIDFRDIVGFNENSAVLMSSGSGGASRVYLTNDGGTNWKLVLSNTESTGFFDAVKFWDQKHGMLLGDPVNGHFTILVTEDGGLTWEKPAQPSALKDEGAFAASGTSLTLLGRDEACFGTGGINGGRVFHTTNAGKSWTFASTPVSVVAASAGVFSLKFRDRRHGIAVGGDYKTPQKDTGTIAITKDGGKTWRMPSAALGYKSAIAYLDTRHSWIAVGSSGSNYSVDGGKTWESFSTEIFNAVASTGDCVLAVGPHGVVSKLHFSR